MIEIVATDPNEIQDSNFEALLAEMNVLHESMQYPGRLVDPDPAKAYIWVHHQNEAMAAKISLGYVITKESKRDVVLPVWRQKDNTFVRGDLILMEAPKERHEAICRYYELKGVENLYNSRSSILSRARQAGMRASLTAEDGVSTSKE